MRGERRTMFRVWRERIVGEDYEEYHIDLEIRGTPQPPEPDVGIMGYWIEDFIALAPGNVPFELTSDEEIQAKYILVNQDEREYEVSEVGDAIDNNDFWII